MFTELGEVRQDEPQPSIFDNVLAGPLPDADRVVAYLRGAYTLIDFMDISNDVFDNTRQVLGGPSVATDGDWYWRDDLAYYLQWHNVTPPGDFLALIRKRHYIVPDVPELRLIELTDPAVRMMSWGKEKQ